MRYTVSAHAATIMEKGGDCLPQIKANQEKLLKKAQALDGLKALPFYQNPLRRAEVQIIA
jgi:hypothetical protein